MFLKVGSLYLPLTVTAAEQSMFFFYKRYAILQDIQSYTAEQEHRL